MGRVPIQSIRISTESSIGTVVKSRQTPNGTVVKPPKPAIGTVVKPPESPNGTVVNPPKTRIGTDVPITQTASQASPTFPIRSNSAHPCIQPLRLLRRLLPPCHRPLLLRCWRLLRTLSRRLLRPRLLPRRRSARL
jgi:hypothetical protein